MSSRALATTGTSSIYKIDWNEVDRYVRSKTLLNCAKITYKSTTETLLRCDQSNGDPSFFSSPSCIVTVELNVLLVFYVRVPNRVWRLEGLPQLPISVRRTPRGGPKGGAWGTCPQSPKYFLQHNSTPSCKLTILPVYGHYGNVPFKRLALWGPAAIVDHFAGSGARRLCFVF